MTSSTNPYLPEAPANGQHVFENSYRCKRCGVYNRPQPENPPFYEPCEGRWAQSGKMRAWAEDKWKAELDIIRPFLAQLWDEAYAMGAADAVRTGYMPTHTLNPFKDNA